MHVSFSAAHFLRSALVSGLRSVLVSGLRSALVS
jgi:hypothetical protein